MKLPIFCLLFFFLMIRRPPRSTLFPSPPLSRPVQRSRHPARDVRRSQAHEGHQPAIGHGHGRSEEHTSELQSPCNLVCRLLLEKKKRDALAVLAASVLVVRALDPFRPVARPACE